MQTMLSLQSKSLVEEGRGETALSAWQTVINYAAAAVGFAMLICFDCHLIEQRNKQTERETDREKERETNRLDCQSSDSWNRLEQK